MRLKWVGTILKYLAGMFCWLVVFSVLKAYCLFDLHNFIDSLWMRELNAELAENAIGEVAFHVRGGNCGADGSAYIFTARYYLRDGSFSDAVRVPLASLVDVSTWRAVEEEGSDLGVHSPHFEYTDSKHRYTMHYTSDSEFISATDR
jgi:hypothetical protein